MEVDLRLEGSELTTDFSVLLFEVQVPPVELLPVAALLQEVLPVDLGLQTDSKGTGCNSSKGIGVWNDPLLEGNVAASCKKS